MTQNNYFGIRNHVLNMLINEQMTTGDALTVKEIHSRLRVSIPYAQMTISTLKYHVGRMELAGKIKPDGFGPSGSKYYRPTVIVKNDQIHIKWNGKDHTLGSLVEMYKCEEDASVKHRIYSIIKRIHDVAIAPKTSDEREKYEGRLEDARGDLLDLKSNLARAMTLIETLFTDSSLWNLEVLDTVYGNKEK